MAAATKEEEEVTKSSKSMAEADNYVFRISSVEEWEELQRNGTTFGGDLDKSSGFFHLSRLNQVKSTLQNFFLNVKGDLYLLQIDAKLLGEGLIHEALVGDEPFPHFYGPDRSFSPLPVEVVKRAEKIVLSDGEFKCALFD